MQLEAEIKNPHNFPYEKARLREELNKVIAILDEQDRANGIKKVRA